MARRPASWTLTYGFDRASMLAALVNGLSLFAIAVWITFEALHRLADPAPAMGGVMLWVALAGLAANLVAFWLLTRADSDNLNMRAALLHVAGDLFGSVAAIGAALVILATGWTPIDPILSVVVVLIILRAAWAVVRDSGHILLEGAPRGFHAREATEALNALPGVATAHHLHAWSVTQERPMATLQVSVAPGFDPQSVRDSMKAMLRDRFGIAHSTVEVETSDAASHDKVR